MPKTQTPTDAIALLKADHRKVEGPVREVREGAKGRTARRLWRRRSAPSSCVHATIEEEIFYPACKGKVEDDLMNEAYVEHDGAKVMIAELLAS